MSGGYQGLKDHLGLRLNLGHMMDGKNTAERD